MARRRMETKPVIFCLKTVLLLYSFVFWVRKIHFFIRLMCCVKGLFI